VITGTHAIIYATDADRARAFFRDVLELPNVDAHEGWLIFKLPPAELAVHPTDGEPMHELYFMCEDIEATLRSLTDAGATLIRPAADQGWGVLAEVSLPSGTALALYEPRHPVAYKLT
jgi:predicted enzyme related to lactoylglutathione lyase